MPRAYDIPFGRGCTHNRLDIGLGKNANVHATFICERLPLPHGSKLAAGLMSCTSTTVSPARANLEFGGQGGVHGLSIYRIFSS
eukprot:2788735-Pyramimonas_sp.AAC.1